MIYQLKSLWGTHSSRLIFNQPSFGIQFWEKLNDSIDVWEETNKQNKGHKVEAIKKIGFVQNDKRGSNFLRLRGYTTMMDFKDVVEEAL